MKKICIALLVLFCITLPLTAQKRGGDNEFGEVKTVDARQNVTLSGKQWAVFIAIDDYKEWSPLLYPVKDAKEIRDILLKYYYFNETEIRELYNKDATVEAIRRLLIELQEKTGPNDSVFVFHAGHGINESKTKTPAWIPYDGGKDVIKQANWLPHLQVRDMLDSLKAKHVFLISDSCYSGDFLDAKRGTSEIIINYPVAYNNVSRQAMSSGASEEVNDLSEFAARLKSTLLRTEKAYITPDFLLSQIIETKTTISLNTIPILAVIPRSSHQLGGSFLFFRKDPKEFPPPLPQQNSQSQQTPIITLEQSSTHESGSVNISGKKTDPAGQTYKIGDTGPAGGIIFYDKGYTGDGWRYLEAAPAGSEFSAEWDAYRQNLVDTMTSVGFGKQNTKLIVERLKTLKQTNKAAQICATLEINGYKDWFLPSRDELDLMHKYLNQKELGSFINSIYWSSSQANTNSAYCQYFNGNQYTQQYNYDKNLPFRVRAVRTF